MKLRKICCGSRVYGFALAPAGGVKSILGAQSSVVMKDGEHVMEARGDLL